MGKKLLFWIALSLCAVMSQAQTDPVATATSYFKLQEGIFSGVGADSLMSNIAKAQFFLIGEEHDMVQLQQLTAAIMPVLKKDGYRHFAVEIGPLSAEKLTSIERNQESLNAFNSRYVKYFGGGPFGFFDGKDEEVLLKSALHNNLDLWGIDFENYNASLFIFDELYRQSSKSTEIQLAYNKARKYVICEYALDKENKKYPLCPHLLNSAEIQQFFSLMTQTSRVHSLINELTISWEIYEQERLNNWYPRVANMKSNFIQEYKQSAQREALPKVFVKLGAVHTARGTSSSGFQEVGNTVYELAKYNGTRSFSIISFARYRMDAKGNITDELEQEDAPILKYTDKDSWNLINLRQLAADGWQGKIKLSAAMQQYIQKYDMMLIPPATKRMKPNYTF